MRRFRAGMCAVRTVLTMLEPLGPLPESVYWRRRAAAAVALAFALLLGVWGLTALADSPGSGAPDTAGSAGPAGAPGAAPTMSATPSATSSDSPSSSAAPSAAPSYGAPSSGAPSSGAPASASATEPGAAAASASPAPSASSDSCPDQAIGLTAQPSAAEYGPGQPREFRMVVTNIGTTACGRDLNPALQELVVHSADGARVWSSNDCYDAGTADVRTLAPGEQLVFTVVWAGRTSEPGCTGRDPVPAGSYQLVAKLGDLSSRPTPFRLAG